MHTGSQNGQRMAELLLFYRENNLPFHLQFSIQSRNIAIVYDKDYGVVDGCRCGDGRGEVSKTLSYI